MNVAKNLLLLILPMAKGYAANHRVGNNEKFIRLAESYLQEQAEKELEQQEVKTVKRLSTRPGKRECIKDYRDLRQRIGHHMTRRVFITISKTGRRYEKLWKNYETFVAEARP